MNERTYYYQQRNKQFQEWLSGIKQQIPDHTSIINEGILRRVVGLTLEATGLELPIGARCRVETSNHEWREAEIVGFQGDKIFLMPNSDIQGLLPKARVVPCIGDGSIAVGYNLLGRVIDSNGTPLDGKPLLRLDDSIPLNGRLINPLLKDPITRPLDVGVRAINALLPIGRGQRLGLFAGSGVGKSTLLGMMTRYTEADIIVVGLIGERGREVRDFIDRTLGEEGLRRSVVVATPADRPPLARLQGAYYATAVAEYFRDQGKHVLLLMDSLTRVAHALREIGLSIGEPPTTRGYPPSVFAKLPSLIERTGNGCRGEGSITAFYTILTEGDDPHEPISDAARAILDGHILLSRNIAETGIYPAIDIEASISRVANEITTPEWRDNIKHVRNIVATYNTNKDLITLGAYHRGSDPQIDEAIQKWPQVQKLLQQDINEPASISTSCERLQQVLKNE